MKTPLALFVVILLASTASAHFRLRCPAPRSTSTGIKSAPCGPEGFGTGPKTTIAPGPLTLIWEESINHPGSPFRVALSSGDDTGYNTHVLLDHIPHNDGRTPVASDSGYKVYFLNVDIPDIDCPNCALQVINPMTDKIPDGSSCTLPGTCTTNTNIYTSCADISITGAQAFASYNWAYSPQNWPYANKTAGVYTQESGTWNNGWLDGQTTTVYGTCENQIPPGITGVTGSSNSAADTLVACVGLFIALISLLVL